MPVLSTISSPVSTASESLRAIMRSIEHGNARVNPEALVGKRVLHVRHDGAGAAIHANFP
ncbi:MAG: hypothetical protein Q8J74_04930 [Candidatus Didemnitutus sp.]|nr:hypothetical protein [Candidatus Didemnitutus sp.]